MIDIPARPGRVAPFDASLLHLCPQPIRAASEALTEALRRTTAMTANLAVAKATVAAASAGDEAAAREAVAAGKVPPTGTTDNAADAADRAERAVAASAQLEVEAQAHYLAVVAEHFDNLVANVAARREAVRGEASQAMDILAGAVREGIVLDDLARELHLGAIRARRPRFEPKVQRRRKDPADAVLAPLRAALGERAGGNVFVSGQSA